MAKEAIRGRNAPTLTKHRKAKIEEFVDLYRGGSDKQIGNASECYRTLYPNAKSESTVRRNSHTMFHHPYTQELLAKKTQEVANKSDITQERVLKEVSAIALFDPRKLFEDDGSPKPLSKIDDVTAAAISGIKKIKVGDDWDVVEYKISDKNTALEKLMRHLGLYQQDNEQKNVSLAEALKAGIQRVKELGE